uniref:Uncharacterized protein n=1 Tax=Rhizophora mucronata TaxID=61149 RepID=A0A2P2NT22_RHIMU
MGLICCITWFLILFIFLLLLFFLAFSLFPLFLCSLPREKESRRMYECVRVQV